MEKKIIIVATIDITFIFSMDREKSGDFKIHYYLQYYIKSCYYMPIYTVLTATVLMIHNVQSIFPRIYHFNRRNIAVSLLWFAEQILYLRDP